MTPPPIVLGLNICEKIIVEEGTRNVTLGSTFGKLAVDGFPSAPQVPGYYQLTLSIDGEWLAQRRMRVVAKES